MSFSIDIKQEICKNTKLQGCCLKAQTAGILTFSKSFSAEKIVFCSEHKPTVELAAGRLSELFGVISQITSPIGMRSEKKKLYTLTVPDSVERAKIVHYYKSAEPPAKKLCCVSAFIGGAFLACGTACNPQKEYRVEFNTPSEKNARLLEKMLLRLSLSARVSERGGQYVVYLSDREAITDLLGYIGAVAPYWELLNTAVERDYRNRAVRTANCDTANLSRTADAAAQQLVAIKKLRESELFDMLDGELKAAAHLREQNPEASLRELCELCGGAVTRSTMSRRLARLCKAAETLKK